MSICKIQPLFIASWVIDSPSGVSSNFLCVSNQVIGQVAGVTGSLLTGYLIFLFNLVH